MSAHGLTCVVPACRSGDYQLALEDPFKYYLTRKLGIANKLSWSKALSRGSWLHKCIEFDLGTPTVTFASGLQQAFEQRLAELQQLCSAMTYDGRLAVLTREQRDYDIARTIYTGSDSVIVPGVVNKPWREFIFRGPFTVIARELHLHVRDPHFPNMPLVGHLDLLLHHRVHNTLWIFDLKSTDKPPTIRLTSCPIENQTLHYPYLLDKLLEGEHLQTRFSLPKDVQFGGMIHLALQKPGIELSQMDRDSRLVDFTPSRGPNKGVTRQEREYFGDPKPELYLKRVLRWFRAEEEYLHLRNERIKEPPVNISFTPASVCCSEESVQQFLQRTSIVYNYAQAPDIPLRYPKNPSSVHSFNELSPLAHLYLNPPDRWQAVLAENGLTSHTYFEDALHDDAITCHN